MNYKKPYLAATTYTIIIGFSFLFVKIALTYTSPIDILAHRFTVAFLFAVLINFHQKKVRGIHLKDVIKIFPLALFYPALFFMFQVFGLAFISTSEAGILQATVPIFTLTLAGIVLKEYADNLRKVSIVISVLGVVYIYIMNDINVESYNITGIVLILLSTLSLAFYNVLARRLTRQYLLFILTFYMTFIGFIAFNGTALIIHLLNNSLSSFWVPLFHSEFIISILYLGVLSSFLTSFLSNFALNHMEASRMSVFNNGAILITVFAGIIFLKETIYYYHVIGAVIIIAGVFGTNYTVKKKDASGRTP